MTETAREEKFISQSKHFIQECLKSFGIVKLENLQSILEKECTPLEPIFIKDFSKLSGKEKLKMKENYIANNGIPYGITTQ